MRLIFDFIYKNLIFAIVGLSVFFIFLHFSYLKLNTADSSIYLSTAENIAHHKGFVVSYNLCQSFNTLYHPVWAYYQPLYSAFCSLFIDHGGIAKVVQVNILFFALNAMLVLYIMQRLMPTRFNVLFVFSLVFSVNFFISALYAWTEQFYFFFFLISFILFLKYKESPKHLLGLGILNAVLMLVRVAHLYNFAAYLPVILLGNGSIRQKFDRVFFFVGGFVLAYGLYQLFCLCTYHVLYPEYARPGASYGMARFTNAIVYDPAKVGLQVSLGSFFSPKNLSCIGHHLRDFYFQMPFFLWSAFFYYFIPAEKRQDGGLVLLCFSQSIFTVLGYSCTFYWLPYYFESLRYSLIPYVLMSMAGWYCMYQILPFSGSMLKKLVGVLVLLCLVYPQADRFMTFDRSLAKYPVLARPYYRDLFVAYGWIDKNLPKEALVASDEDQEGYFMHRPFISLPPGRSFNCANLALYNKIYAPDYYLLSVAVADKCFVSIPSVKVFSNKIFRVLKVAKSRK